MKNVLKLVLVILFLSGCSMPTMLPHTTALSNAENKVIVIGKFELDPPIDVELEQTTYWNALGDGRILNKVFVATGTRSDRIYPGPMDGSDDWQATIEATWGVPFMVEVPRRTTWLRGAVTYLDSMQRDVLSFPGGVYFQVPENADVVYIGTFRYIRDDFNNIQYTEIVDEYHQAMDALGLDDSANVTRSLLKSGR